METNVVQKMQAYVVPAGWAEGRSGLAACGLLPQHTEMGTVLQTATRSVL